MHEDPTRRMDVPPPDEPRRSGLSTGVKVVLGVLIATVLGLGVALAVVASDDDDDDGATSAVTAQPTTTEPTTTQPTTEPTTTEPTTTDTTTTQPTTTTTTTTVTEPGSGGTEAP